MRMVVDFTGACAPDPPQTDERLREYARQDFLQGCLWKDIRGVIWHPDEMAPMHAQNVCRMMRRNARMYVNTLSIMWYERHLDSMTATDFCVSDEEAVEFIMSTNLYRLCEQRAALKQDTVRVKIETPGA